MKEIEIGQRVMAYGTVKWLGTKLVLVTFKERYELWMHLDVLHPSDEPRPFQVGDVVTYYSVAGEFTVDHLYPDRGNIAIIINTDGTRVAMTDLGALTLVRPAS